MPPLRCLRIAALALLIVPPSLAGCGNGKIGITPHASGPRSPGITMDNFNIRMQPPTTTAGRVDLDVVNQGPSVHQLTVIRTDLPANKLPLDGVNVDLSAPGLDSVASTRNLNPGDEVEETVNLRPGRYVFVCNIAGHYLEGMFKTVRVSGR